jgi:hypothetical protein
MYQTIEREFGLICLRVVARCRKIWDTADSKAFIEGVEDFQRLNPCHRLLHLERETGIEPATNGLGSRYSTIELLPLRLQLYCGRRV